MRSTFRINNCYVYHPQHSPAIFDKGITIRGIQLHKGHSLNYRFHLLEKEQLTRGVLGGNFFVYWQMHVETLNFLYMLPMAQEVFFLVILLHSRYYVLFYTVICT